MPLLELVDEVLDVRARLERRARRARGVGEHGGVIAPIVRIVIVRDGLCIPTVEIRE